MDETKEMKAVDQRMDGEVRENSNRTKRSTLKNFQRRRGEKEREVHYGLK